MLYVPAAGQVGKAPIYLNGLVRSNLLLISNQFNSRLLDFYRTQFLRDAYKMILASELLGNPVGVATALNSGLREFVAETAAGRVGTLICDNCLRYSYPSFACHRFFVWYLTTEPLINRVFSR